MCLTALQSTAGSGLQIPLTASPDYSLSQINHTIRCTSYWIFRKQIIPISCLCKIRRSLEIPPYIITWGISIWYELEFLFLKIKQPPQSTKKPLVQMPASCDENVLCRKDRLAVLGFPELKEESSCTAPAGKSHSSSSSWGGWRPLLRMTSHPCQDASKVASEREGY